MTEIEKLNENKALLLKKMEGLETSFFNPKQQTFFKILTVCLTMFAASSKIFLDRNDSISRENKIYFIISIVLIFVLFFLGNYYGKKYWLNRLLRKIDLKINKLNEQVSEV